MDKQKRWQFWLIAAVLLVTLYNVFPTIFWYSKPLRDRIDEQQAQTVAKELIERVDTLEEESVAWIHSFAKLLRVDPDQVILNRDKPHLISVQFKNEKQARIFAKYLPRAGGAIPFVPGQLSIIGDPNQAITKEEGLYTIHVERNLGSHLNPETINQYFIFTDKLTPNRDVTPFYKELVFARVQRMMGDIAGPSSKSRIVQEIINNPGNREFDDLALSVAQEINLVTQTFGEKSPIAKRYFASFTAGNFTDKSDAIQKFIASLSAQKSHIDEEVKTTKEKAQKAESKGELQNIETSQTTALLTKQSESLTKALRTLQDQKSVFASGSKPLTRQDIENKLNESFGKINKADMIEHVDLKGTHPYISALYIDWSDDRVSFILYDDVTKARNPEQVTEGAALTRDALNRLLFKDIAMISRSSDEVIKPYGDVFALDLNELSNSQSLIALKLGAVAEERALRIAEQLQNWNPEHPELQAANFPIMSWANYQKAPAADKRMALIVYAPAAETGEPLPSFKPGSLYVIANGLVSIAEKYRDKGDAGQLLASDFNDLQQQMSQLGFIVYRGDSFGAPEEFKNAFIFELEDYYGTLLAATRENFYVKGDKKYAVLEFTDLEQRLVTNNKIDDRIQEDLVKWSENYASTQANLDPSVKFMVPPPTESPYLANLKLTAKKYFRGDDRKILKWGLDLSGGKTVRIGLRDSNNRPVTNQEEVNQAMNELYTRINKMGVSERTIRSENDTIILDFPGSQAFSASELVKASAMTFHVINEKFSPTNKDIGSTVNEFLKDVWNEAVVTNRKDIDSINEIAWRALGGDLENPDVVQPKTETAQILWDRGLRLANPIHGEKTSQFNDTLSAIAMYRGDDLTEWRHQTHPLLIVFNNFALEGSSLSDVSVGFDPKQGNMLTFSVKRSFDKAGQTGSPQQDLFAWTSQFAEEKIQGTPKEAYAPGGWKMAVVLNGKVVSEPALKGALSDHGSIFGRFTQREINQLAADLKAGSLSFTPKILSEQNVSAELGKEERTKGIFASLIALAAVVTMMVGVYRFAGVIASIAVLFNLLIMWGILQSIGAALTLPGIAGVVLTIGMAVDANVLVFERIREEFAVSGRIASAIHAGYKKAFSAILDSNLTTIMAAVILIQFDSGPIKAFAVMLIIGILSSMFTALFLTRYYFNGWAENPNNKELKMAKLFSETNIDFLKYAKPAILISLLIIGIGGYFLYTEKNTLFGMDFTGGYSLTLDLNERAEANYRLETKEALVKAGASPAEVEVRELSRPNQLRIQFGMSMEEAGHPFYGLPSESAQTKVTYPFETNPRISWVVDALAKQGLDIQNVQLMNLDKNWSVMSGQLSDAMRHNALLALGIALFGVLVYITFRFEFKYAFGAVVALLHDILITVGLIALFHMWGFPIEINLQAIGAIMTIIGYSLNDTIIVFDRVREEAKLYRKWPFEKVINHALNITLNRTLMTSGTTLIVLVALVLFGGPSIFGFSLIMTMGVLIGTISSLFVASPVMLWVHRRQENSDHVTAN